LIFTKAGYKFLPYRWGCFEKEAEKIPLEPDPDNTGGGKRNPSFPFQFFCPFPLQVMVYNDGNF
jgi:hypothetical protein